MGLNPRSWVVHLALTEGGNITPFANGYGSVV